MLVLKQKSNFEKNKNNKTLWEENKTLILTSERGNMSTSFSMRKWL